MPFWILQIEQSFLFIHVAQERFLVEARHRDLTATHELKQELVVMEGEVRIAAAAAVAAADGIEICTHIPIDRFDVLHLEAERTVSPLYDGVK